jgi:diguanylate cyclase (GGDEF)-like protein
MEIGIALERAQQYEEAREQADRDFLTGLYGHRALQAELGRALQASSRRGEPLAIVAMDIDNFKLFNDTYGHSAGDQVLKMIAEHLAKLRQDNDLAGRFGGDDFMVILPKADRQTAFAFARSIQGWLSEKHFQVRRGERIPISVSCGVAVFPEDGQKRHELLAVADANLYESKGLGGRIVGRPESQEQKAELRKLGTFGMLESLVTSIDNKDHYTKAHSELVTDYAVMLAQELGYSEQVQKTLRIAGLLHDVGKICIPDRILRKPGPLTPGEYEIVKHHVVIAENLLVDLPNVDQVRVAALNHHERFDGMGYPNGLEGQRIPLLGRIMAIADASSAMILDRPYRKRRTIREALAELQRCAGTQLDPELVEPFVRAVERQEAVAELSRA